MRIVKKSGTPFFLTGGTALSRHYFNHRFSDDLDLFVVSNEAFQELLDTVLTALTAAGEEGGFLVDRENIRRFESYAQVFLTYVSNPKIQLKVYFVNDSAGHFGSFEFHETLGKIDGWRNILSNKLTALFRFEPKDVADIWVIAKKKKFDWKAVVKEAKTKEAGVEPEVVFNILKSFPIQKLDMVKWTRKPDYAAVKKDLDRIADELFYGKVNEPTSV